MRPFLVLPVAFAAVVMSLSAHAEATSSNPAKSSKHANVATAAGEAEDCPYLFGCPGRQKAVFDVTKSGAKGAKSGKDGAATASKASHLPYSSIISRYAATYGVPLQLAHAVVKIESNYRPNARGSAGEVGLMQIKPATARMMGYSGSVKGLYDPETNIRYGMKYLAEAHRLSGGETCGTVLRYNAGHAAKRMNPVSQRYCGKVKVQLAGA